MNQQELEQFADSLETSVEIIECLMVLAGHDKELAEIIWAAPSLSDLIYVKETLEPGDYNWGEEAIVIKGK